MAEKEKLSSMSAAVKIVIDDYPIGHKFFGNELHDDVARIYPDARDMYPDTILKMARRHRRDSYICIDRNNSQYMRVKSAFEIEKENIEKKRAEEQARIEREKQTRKPEQVTLFSQGFFAFCFLVFFGAFCFLAGRPIFTSLIAIQSSSVYTPIVPMRMNGSLLAVSSLLCITQIDSFVPFLSIGRSDIFLTVKGVLSIPTLYRQNTGKNQVKNTKVSNYLETLLHRRIVKIHKICKFSENFIQTLDRAVCPTYSINIYVSKRLETLINGTGETGSRMGSRGAEGDFYERLQEFSGMA